jgi:hypothetical protein
MFLHRTTVMCKTMKGSLQSALILEVHKKSQTAFPKIICHFFFAASKFIHTFAADMRRTGTI